MKFITFFIFILFTFDGLSVEFSPPQLVENFHLSSESYIFNIIFDRNSTCYYSIIFLKDRLYLKNHNETDAGLKYLLDCQISTEIRSRNQRIYFLCKDTLYFLFNFPDYQIQKSQFTFTPAHYHLGFDFSMDEEVFVVTNLNQPFFDLARKQITLTIQHLCSEAIQAFFLKKDQLIIVCPNQFKLFSVESGEEIKELQFSILTIAAVQKSFNNDYILVIVPESNYDLYMGRESLYVLSPELIIKAKFPLMNRINMNTDIVQLLQVDDYFWLVSSKSGELLFFDQQTGQFEIKDVSFDKPICRVFLKEKRSLLINLCANGQYSIQEIQV